MVTHVVVRGRETDGLSWYGPFILTFSWLIKFIYKKPLKNVNFLILIKSKIKSNS